MDFTNRYNTELTPEEEQKFQEWAQANGRLNDLYDYDLRGFYKDGGQFADNGHGSDYYKKPNHPTFSDQSQYHGADGHYGGSWMSDPVAGFAFAPSHTNIQFHGTKGLQDYFQRAEPNANLGVADDGLASLLNPFKAGQGQPLMDLFNPKKK